MKYENYFRNDLKKVEAALDQLLPPATQYPAAIHEAMRYAVFSGGKRFRPVLTLSACEAAGGNSEDALIPAVSIELIHCYSLVHDDLPALDNDDMRRGQLSCHKRYGEAMAVLAGDGLLNLAYQILPKISDPKTAIKILSEISTAAGTYGMIGGQIADLMAAQQEMNVALFDYISSHKTGKLITASAVCGAISAKASEDVVQALMHYGECLGLAFQSVDDLHDGDGYLSIVKSKEVVQKIRDLIAKGKKEIKGLGSQADKLHALADYLLERIPQGKHVPLDR